jgi:RNA polymerase sigma factor (sigma-70 family)
VRRYQGIAHRTAFLVTREGAEAEDAAQTAFVKAYGALGRFDPDRPFRPWLLRIVTNEARNRVRSATRRAGLELAAGAEPAADEPAASPEATAVGGERRRALLEAVNGLGEPDREVIAFRYFLELSEAETAEALGVARGTVKSRLSRALSRLRDALAAAGVDAEDAGAAYD